MDSRPRRALSRTLAPISLLLWLTPGPAAAADLFWYRTSGVRSVLRCDVASCVPADFATPLSIQVDGDLGIDPLEGMVYWAVNTGTATSKIQRKSLHGGAVEDIFALPSSMTGIAIDPAARLVYVATPGVATRIWRYPIDDPANPTAVLTFNEAGCAPTCSPQGLALDLAGGFLYWADSNGTISRKPLDLSGTVQGVVIGLSQPRAIALDVANDRVYFSQVTPIRISYALLSSPATVTDLVNPVPGSLFPGSFERDPTVGTLGELYVALQDIGEVRHCSLDAGCPTPLVLLADGATDVRGLALLVMSQVPALGAGGVVLLVVLLLASAVLWRGDRAIWKGGASR